MTLVVKKFGGSSLADLDCMRRVAQVITEAVEQGQQLVVVVSAVKGETDRLVQAARAITVFPDPREYDALLASAEQSSAALLSLLLIAQDIPAISLAGFQAGIATNNQFNKAHVESVNTARIQSHLSQGKVVVVTGFQGIDQRGDITTLGRGGSDMTAVALAVSLRASECHVYTDVEGVYSADPNRVPGAYRLDTITLAEMQQMASLGAKVMQQQALDYCYQHPVPLRVLSTFSDSVGTYIVDQQSLVEGRFSGVSCQARQAQITLCDVSDVEVVERALNTMMASAAIDIDLIVTSMGSKQHCFDVHFTVDSDDYPRALLLAHELAQSCGVVAVRNDPDIAKVSLIGSNIQSSPNIVSRCLAVCEQADIAVKVVVSTATRITMVIKPQQLTQAACLLHQAFIEQTALMTGQPQGLITQ